MSASRKLSYVNGVRLKKAVMAAAQRVEKIQDRLNQINVFPVADQDTGTNMAQTLKGAVDALRDVEDADLARISDLLADAALLSARGNSGVILAQFFQGMSCSFAGHRRVGLEAFVRAMRQAASSAEKAVAAPCEGTILTVMRAWAHSIERNCHAVPGFADLLQSSLDDAHAAVQRTSSQLKVLAKAKVVDAGAQGFVYMLEGIMHLLETGESQSAEEMPLQPAIAQPNIEDDATFRFCTECIIQGTDIDLASIRTMAESVGNSVVVAGGKAKVRIHVHTNDPALLFARAAAFGIVSGPKQDDIWAQKDAARRQSKAMPIAVITDSSCDLPADYLRKHNIFMVPLKVSFGRDEYLDRVTITSEEIYDMMEQSPHPPKTSQATPMSFLETYEQAAKNYHEAIAIIVTSAGTGTFQSAAIAAQKQDAMKIEVVDSRTSSAALGFLVEAAVEAIEEGCSLPEVRRRVEEARSRTKVFFSISNLAHLVRTGRVGPTSGRIAKLLGLVPILSFNAEGKIVSVSKSRPGKISWAKLVDMAIREGAGLTKPRFHVCHSAEEQGARYLVEELVSRLHIDPPEILKISPTMGAMVGPGVCVIAVTGTRENLVGTH